MLIVLLGSFGPDVAISQSEPRDSQVIELQYDDALSRAGFPNPLLEATINGQTAWFIVDTGAGVHTFASWFINAAGLKAIGTDSIAKDSTGVESRVSVLRDISLHLERQNRELALREAIVANFPPVFQDQRIGGLISPQLLAPAGESVILDLRIPRLSFSSIPLASKEARVCINRDSQFTNRLYAVEVSVAGTKARLLLDTGATSTVIALSSSVAGSLSKHISGRGQVQGVAGEMIETRKTEPLQILLAGVAKVLPVVLGKVDDSCAPDGLLGMDALRGCVLSLGSSTFTWSCR